MSLIDRAVDVLRAYERWQAACALLALPDPPEMPPRRSWVTYEGYPERFDAYQHLAVRYQTHRMVDRDNAGHA